MFFFSFNHEAWEAKEADFLNFLRAGRCLNSPLHNLLCTSMVLWLLIQFILLQLGSSYLIKAHEEKKNVIFNL